MLLPKSSSLRLILITPRSLKTTSITLASRYTFESLHGPALDLFPQLISECSSEGEGGGTRAKGPFQLVFIDADKENNRAYFGEALKVVQFSHTLSHIVLILI